MALAQGQAPPGVVVATAAVEEFPLAVEALGNALAKEAVNALYEACMAY